jgi:hypothetical protein
MMNNVKAQGLSMSTIIIAAISLLVLVLLATFLLKGSGQFSEGTECEAIAEGAVCDTSCSELSDYDGITYIDRGQTTCPDDYTCCVPVN